MMMTFLLLWQTIALNLIPQYRSGTDSSCSHDSFSPAFTTIPTVLVYINYEDHTYGTTKYRVQVTPGSVTLTGFDYSCTNDVNGGSTQIGWFAYVDDNIHYVSNAITTVPSSITITFPIPQTTIPAVAFLVTGKGIVTSNSYMNYVITVDTATLTDLTVHVNPGAGFTFNYLAYTLIYASPDYFSGGQMTGTTGSCFLAQPILTNFPIQGYHVLSTINSDNIRVTPTSSGCSTGQIKVYGWAQTTITSWSLTYFQYSPCPYYCTSCSAAVYPNCDSCKAITLRTSSDCSQCQLQYYILSGQYICASCLSYCSGCSGSASSCTACNPVTQRILAPGPACSTCPASFYIQVGFDNCQCINTYNLECASYCQTCVNSNVSCTACLTGSNRILASNCMTCPITMYVQVGVDTCQCKSSNLISMQNLLQWMYQCTHYMFSMPSEQPQIVCTKLQYMSITKVYSIGTRHLLKQQQPIKIACSTICNNCSSTSTNCTSCLASTYRLNPPNCQTCPPNMFLQIGQDNCQSCNIVCNQCTVSGNNCTACNGLYRTNAPSCDQCSQLNYYIDSQFNDCQPCASYCNGCLTSSTNCIACWPFNFQQFVGPDCSSCPTEQFILSPSQCNVNIAQLICSINYNRDSSCNCLSGYYNNQNSLSCLKCSNNCETCTGSPTNCIKCNSKLLIYLPPYCNYCIDGYYMLYSVCTQCSNSCQTCNQSSTNCLTCTLPRMNPPQCNCPNGYFNNCTQSCSSKCITCTSSQDNCLICAGNRINPPTCSCPDGSIQSSVTCSSCYIAVPTARFSDDLTSIEITFQYQLKTVMNCFSLLSQFTAALMGTNFGCEVTLNILTFKLGSKASISIDQPVIFNSDQLQFSMCNTSITNISTPLVQMPSNLYPPQIELNSIQFTTTPCDNVLINIIGFKYDGQRDLALSRWRIIDSNNQVRLNPLIDQWNLNPLQSNYTISPQYLQNQQRIVLMIFYTNFLGQQSNQTISITIQPHILILNAFVPTQFYIFETAEIIYTPSLLQCGQSLVNQPISLQLIISNSTKTLSYNYTVTSDTQQAISFNPFELSLYSKYYLQAHAVWRQLEITVSDTFQVVPYVFTVSIQGGDQQIGINQQLNLTVDIFDPDIVIEQFNMSQYSINWQCMNIVTNMQCSGFSVKEYNAIIDTANYQPYTTLQVQVNAQKNSTQSNNIITVQILQDQINQIKIQGNKYQLNTPMNIYDSVDVSIYYLSQVQFDIDKLTYQAIYLDSAYSQNIIEFSSTQTTIDVNNFPESQQQVNGKFKVMITQPSNQYSSVATQNIRINTPPQKCKLSISNRRSQYIFSINNCISEQQPLKYQFIYYQSNEDLIIDSSQGIINKGILLTDYQIQPSFTTYLMGSNSTWILVKIKDRSNGLANVSMSLQVVQVIDLTLFGNMFKDNTIDLPRNIFFMLEYVSINNQKFTEKYLNQISHLLEEINSTNLITLQIQQLLASQLSLSNSQIVNQLSEQSNVINNLSLQLTKLQRQQSQGIYNKDYQIELLQLESQLFASTNHISFLYDQSQNSENRRILIVSGQNLTQLITGTVQNITDIVGNLTKVNQKQKAIQTPQFNLSAQKFSTNNINQNFGMQIINQSNQTVSFKNQQFGVNPYQNQSDFANPVKAPLIIPNLTDTNSIQIKPANPIPINFPLIGDVEVSCASQIGSSWSLDVCQLVKSTTVQCLCQTLSPLSIVQALQYIISQFGLLFVHTIIQKINNFPYYQVVFTYILAIFIIVFFFAKFMLHRQDANESTRVHPAEDIVQMPIKVLNSAEDQDTNYRVLNITSIKDLNQEELLYNKGSLLGEIKSQNLSKKQGFIKFLKNSHIIFELYYRYDEQEPRILRLNILFLQMLGQLCIFVLFGKNLAISIVIGLSLFQTAYGIVFQIILSKMIKSKNKYIYSVGMIIAISLTGLCAYLIIASISLYTSIYTANIAGISYLASFVIDHFITSICVELGKYVFLIKTCQSEKYKKLYEIILPTGLQIIVFGKKLTLPKTASKI